MVFAKSSIACILAAMKHNAPATHEGELIPLLLEDNSNATVKRTLWWTGKTNTGRTTFNFQFGESVPSASA